MKLKQKTELKPFLKWPGGKTRELKYIIPNLPEHINNYYEPFIGGGAAYFAISDANYYYINDKSKDLIELYKNIKKPNNDFFINVLNEIDNSWLEIEFLFQKNKEALFDIYLNFRHKEQKKILKTDVDSWVEKNAEELINVLPKSINIFNEIFLKESSINLNRKMSRMSKIEQKKGLLSDIDIELNILTSLKSAVYMYYRFLHNNPQKLSSEINSSVYYFIRNYTYSSMFRYNSKGEFNVPYGGMGYNNNKLTSKISYLKSNYLKDRLKDTTIENLDFFDFFIDKKLNDTDFIFLDPPYDTEFSTYDKNSFDLKDQQRLADFLINQVNCNWMLIIKNTDFIYNLYDKKNNVSINFFDKKYAVSFMNRNERNTEHLMITNYEI